MRWPLSFDDGAIVATTVIGRWEGHSNMARVIYVDGQYVPYASASVHPEDRGYQFGDAVYEVCEVRSGAIIDEARHLDRLERSLGELDISQPMPRRALERVLRETVRRNRVRNGVIYLQVSRGTARRDFLFPAPGTPPTVVCLARPSNRAAQEASAARGIKVITEPDPRWNRCDIKTVMLLPASLAKERARAQGASEVWFVDANGHVTEGGSSNAWIVTKDGEVLTRQATPAILRGVTRMTAIDALDADGLSVSERPFTVEEAKAAREAFITSASNLVMPVVEIDGAPIANGHPGSLTLRLRANFHQVAQVSR